MQIQDQKIEAWENECDIIKDILKKKLNEQSKEQSTDGKNQCERIDLYIQNKLNSIPTSPQGNKFVASQLCISVMLRIPYVNFKTTFEDDDSNPPMYKVFEFTPKEETIHIAKFKLDIPIHTLTIHNPRIIINQNSINPNLDPSKCIEIGCLIATQTKWGEKILDSHTFKIKKYENIIYLIFEIYKKNFHIQMGYIDINGMNYLIEEDITKDAGTIYGYKTFSIDYEYDLPLIPTKI